MLLARVGAACSCWPACISRAPAIASCPALAPKSPQLAGEIPLPVTWSPAAPARGSPHDRQLKPGVEKYVVSLMLAAPAWPMLVADPIALAFCCSSGGIVHDIQS